MIIFDVLFLTKSLKLLSLTLSNVIYSYLCHSLIFRNLAKSTKYNDCLTMNFQTHYDMIINYTLLYIFNLISFENNLRTFEEIQGNNPGSGNSASVA